MQVLQKVTLDELVEVCEEICDEILLPIPDCFMTERDLYGATMIALSTVFGLTPPLLLKSTKVDPSDYAYVYGVMTNVYFMMRDDEEYEPLSPTLKERYKLPTS